MITDKISIIVPLYNEEKNIEELYNEIKENVKNFELIFVDDGSNDKTWDVIKSIALKDFRIKAIRLTRNFGQTQALKAGIKEATSSIIITMDGDLQNDPKDIPMIINKIYEGYDLVSGWRKKRKDSFLTRTLPSKMANVIISLITGVKLNDYGCTLKAYRKEYIEKIDLYGEMHRFIPALCSYLGAKITEVEVNHRVRKYGKSKYGFKRTFKVIFDLLMVKFFGGMINKPIYLFGSVSVILFVISIIFFLITLYNKWYNHIFVKDQPLFLVGIFMLLVSVQMALIGIIAEILTRIYYKDRVEYIVKEKIYDKKQMY
ncbi:MAG: glycosyltransferase family 2 protein [Elusimicrobiales bacterium]|nr:glycosyltransferase family 2 protein [Elusimicrobiales bacterium]